MEATEPTPRQAEGIACAQCRRDLAGDPPVEIGLRRADTGAVWNVRLCPDCGRAAALGAFLTRAARSSATRGPGAGR